MVGAALAVTGETSPDQLRLYMWILVRGERNYSTTVLAGYLGIEAQAAVGANAVTKFNCGMVAEIAFHLMPIAGVIANFFAGSANRQQPL